MKKQATCLKLFPGLRGLYFTFKKIVLSANTKIQADSHDSFLKAIEIRNILRSLLEKFG